MQHAEAIEKRERKEVDRRDPLREFVRLLARVAARDAVEAAVLEQPDEEGRDHG